MPGDDLIGQEHATSVDVEIDVPFVVGQLERMLHRRNARIGDEDLASPQLSQSLFEPTLDRTAFSHVDFDKTLSPISLAVRRPASMSRSAMAMLTPHPESAVGISYLWDPVTSIAIAAATGASFVGEIFTGLFASDMGLWQPDCAGAVRLRRRLGREDMELFYNINAEFAHSLDARPCAQAAPCLRGGEHKQASASSSLRLEGMSLVPVTRNIHASADPHGLMAFGILNETLK